MAAFAFRGQANVTDIYTPQGDCIHKTYRLAVIYMSPEKLCYISRFPVPVGTKMCVSVLRNDQQSRIFTIVFLNEKTPAGRYRVQCNNLRIVSENSRDKTGLIINRTLWTDTNSKERYCIDLSRGYSACCCKICENRLYCGACTGRDCFRNYCFLRFEKVIVLN